MKVRNSIRMGFLAALAALSLSRAHGAERVTLNNGFAVECNHHAEVAGRVRLYLDAGDSNYMDFKPEDVASVETATSISHAQSGSADGHETGERLTHTDVKQILSAVGKTHNLDVDLLASVIKAESAGNAHAVSRAGAQGLMQLMPATASTLGVTNSFEPGENVRGGSTYLDALLTRYHENLAFALAAYNAGPAAVDRYHGIPPYRETRIYVARVIHEFNRRVKAREAQLLADNDVLKRQSRQGTN